MAIRKLTISGFRGILAPLSLDFAAKDGTVRSMVVYGRNGTGKSSITDAWEWVHIEGIAHLGREGAGPSTYPHRSAADGHSYVEIEFADSSLGVVRLDYDHKRITRPKVTGNVAAFRARMPHPCHVRFADLTRFVYLTKADRYDLLAQLMGFEPQVDYQKALRRVQKELVERAKIAATKLTEATAALKGLLNLTELTAQGVTDAILDVLARHGIAADSTWETVKLGVGELKTRVEKDPNALRLADLREFGSKLKAIRPAPDLFDALNAYLRLARPFKDDEEILNRLLLLALYEKGAEVLSQRRDSRACPLCGEEFEGDLQKHVSAELARLRELKEVHDALEAARAKALQFVAAALPDLEPLTEAVARLKNDPVYPASAAILARLAELRLLCEALGDDLRKESKHLDQAAIESARRMVRSLTSQGEALATERARVLNDLACTVRQLQADDARTRLVDDFQRVHRATVDWEAYRTQIGRYRALAGVYRTFKDMVDAYIAASLRDVGRRFDAISANVATYFETLEQDTVGVGQPVLKILPDQDRSVILEVLFHGQATSPAYKYLSESQLNSFGLAVFLASAQHFNPEFKFLLLDDVVNSLDGYKRPQLITVLKRYFSEYQVLLLTHDSVWRDRLYRELPTWKRLHFKRFDFGLGPVAQRTSTHWTRCSRTSTTTTPDGQGRSSGPTWRRCCRTSVSRSRSRSSTISETSTRSIRCSTASGCDFSRSSGPATRSLGY